MATTGKSPLNLAEDDKVDEMTQRALDNIAASPTPISLHDAMVSAGCRNPFQIRLISRKLTTALAPGGTHYHLTQQRKWLRTGRAQWAVAAGVEMGKRTLPFAPRIATLESLSDRFSNKNTLLSEAYKERGKAMLDTLRQRAGKSLDVASTALLVEDLQTFASEYELLRKDLINKENELKKESQHRQEMKEQNDKIIRILEAITVDKDKINRPVAAE